MLILNQKKEESTSEMDDKYLDILTNDLSLGSLAYIIYDNYSNLDKILPKLNILRFNLNDYGDEIKEEMVKPDETDIYTVRLSTISKGTRILYKKYGGLLSHLLTFMYFFVKYIFKNNNKSFIQRKINKNNYMDPRTFIPDHNCINYIMNFVPLVVNLESGKYTLPWYHPNRPVNNSIMSHLYSGYSGHSPIPHFFISSIKIDNTTSNKTTNYEVVAKRYADIASDNSNTIPVKIYFKLDKKNPGVFEGYENDYVLSPFIKSDYIAEITRLDNGEIISLGNDVTMGGSNKKRIKIKHKNKIIKKKNTKKKAYIKQKKNSKKNKSLNAKKTKKKNK